MEDLAVRTDLSDLVCPICGSRMEPGFILSKQTRPRWSATRTGVTVFSGTPLTSYPKGFWLSADAWTRSPALEAVRCVRCGVGIFRFEPHATPIRSGKRAFAFLIGGVFCMTAAVVSFITALRLTLHASSGIPFFAVAALLEIAGLALVVRGAIETT